MLFRSCQDADVAFTEGHLVLASGIIGHISIRDVLNVTDHTVEHFSHFPVAYPLKTYDAHSVAVTLFKHFCTYGAFDTLASDPGSAFTSDVVNHMLQWLGQTHRLSLIGRHESNGCEGSIKQFLRHLTTLVMDERLHDEWGGDTVLPWINFMLGSYPTSETGGYTPFQLKYGTEDARAFRLPTGTLPEPGEQCAALIKSLDTNLAIVREKSRELQAKIALERAAHDAAVSAYEPGDLVLWNPREHSRQAKATKLTPNFLGPYRVVRQVKNDIEVRHVVLNTEHVFHVDRLKPFVGSLEDAIRVAKDDQNQYFIQSINWYTGNPFKRSSLTFNVTFEDGTVDVPYSADLAQSQQFQDFVAATPALFPLRFTAVDALKEIAALNKLAITTLEIGQTAWLNLRYYDHQNLAWYDSLGFPDKSKTYVVPIKTTKWTNKQHTKIDARVPLMSHTIDLTTYAVQAFVFTSTPDPAHAVVLTDADKSVLLSKSNL